MIPTKLTSAQLLTRDRKKEEVDHFLRAPDSPLALQQTPGSIPSSKITSGQNNTRNFWPNPNSEVDPPSGYTPPGDGTDPEFDFRYNAGAGAYSGNWVRRLTRTTAGTTTLKFRVPCSFDEGLQFKCWYKWVASGGGASASVNARRLKADLTTYDTPISINLLTSNTVWTTSGDAGFNVNNTNIVWVEFSVDLTTSSAGTADLYIDSLLASFIIVDADLAIGAVTTTKILLGNVTANRLSAQESWNALSFGANWSDLGGAWSTCQYMKDHLGFVHLKGHAKYALMSGAGTTIGTLPAGYRPATNSQRKFVCSMSDGTNDRYGQVTVKADGTILCDDFAGVTLNGTGSISLEGHTFDTR